MLSERKPGALKLDGNGAHSTFDFAFLQLVQALGVTNLGVRRLFPPPLLASSPPPLLDSPAVVPRAESDRGDGSELLGSLRREKGEVLITHVKEDGVERARLCGLPKGSIGIEAKVR